MQLKEDRNLSTLHIRAPICDLKDNTRYILYGYQTTISEYAIMCCKAHVPTSMISLLNYMIFEMPIQRNLKWCEKNEVSN